MKQFFTNYISHFRGLSREIWLLSLVTLINRAGAMVLPFLSLYLVEAKCFTLPQVGWIMTSYGIGSFVGALIGGKLTDSIGFYKVIVGSLLFGGLGFVGLQFLDTFYGLCIGMMILSALADAYRPAIFVACDAYSKPENVTRAIALIRLAINLGFSIGPLIGGLIIARINYSSLFWIDGITCALAAFLLFLVLKPKKIEGNSAEQKAIVKEGVSPYKNALYLLLIIIMVLSTITFIQYFSVLPLYYAQRHLLSADVIGLLLFLNGALIVVFEMPIVGWLERINISKSMATFWGMILISLSFLVMNITSWSGILVIGTILMTIGEMVGSPFANALALSMAPKGRKGTYMGLYSMSFSMAHIVGHNSGMNLVDQFGYDFTWYVMALVLLIVAAMCIWMYRLLKKSKEYVVY